MVLDLFKKGIRSLQFAKGCVVSGSFFLQKVKVVLNLGSSKSQLGEY